MQRKRHLARRLRIALKSVKTKLILLTVLLIVFTVIFSTAASYYRYTQDFEQKSMESTLSTIRQLTNNLNSYLSGLFKSSQAVYYNTTLMDELSADTPPTLLGQLHREWAVEDQLNSLIYSAGNDIISAYIITPTTIYSAGISQSDVDQSAPLNTYAWYQQALETSSPIYVPTHTEQLVTHPQNKVFSIVRRINSLYNNERILGVEKIDADYSSIQSICDQVHLGENGGLLIQDQNGACIYSSLHHINNSSVYHMASQKGEGAFQANIGGNSYYITSATVENAMWTVISVSSMKDFQKESLRTRNVTIVVDLICSGIAVILLLLIISNFLRPLFEIVSLMRKVQTGDFNVSFREKREDEIGYLGTSFNTMVLRIRSMMKENSRLIREIYESRLAQKQAQIDALYSQIRPHFLFNTLNLISLSIRCGKQESALQNLEKLSDLLRYLVHFNQENTVFQEVKLLKDYIDIQKCRYGDRLQCHIDIDDGFYPLRIPSMILQPIVENSIIHGCEHRREPTKIEIFARKMENGMEFHIKDNAGGISAEMLETIRRRLREDLRADTDLMLESAATPVERNGVGIINVHRRIRFRCGSPYGLEIYSEENKGTETVLLLPLHLQEGKKE